MSRNNLLVSLREILETDFPKQWPALIPFILQVMVLPCTFLLSSSFTPILMLLALGVRMSRALEVMMSAQFTDFYNLFALLQ